MAENDVPKELSPEQVERLLVAIEHLKTKGNIMAELIWTAVEKHEDRDSKRKVIVRAFAQTYELLLSMNMAVNSKVSAKTVEKRLRGKR